MSEFVIKDIIKELNDGKKNINELDDNTKKEVSKYCAGCNND